jgi:hypothetical protein
MTPVSPLPAAAGLGALCYAITRFPPRERGHGRLRSDRAALRHLAADGVLHAHEQDLGDLLGDRALDLTQRAQALAGEAVDEERHEVLEARATTQRATRP